MSITAWRSAEAGRILFSLGYRDDSEALRERIRTLEAELAELSARAPSALESRCEELETELRSLRGTSELAARDAEEQWVIEAHARNGRRVLHRMVMVVVVEVIGLVITAKVGRKPGDWAVVAAPLSLLMMLWAVAANARCPKCSAKLTVRKGDRRRCEVCRAAVLPPLED